jgi:hypothetical protein
LVSGIEGSWILTLYSNKTPLRGFGKYSTSSARRQYGRQSRSKRTDSTVKHFIVLNITPLKVKYMV